MVDGNIMNLDAVSDSLKRGWKRMGSGIKNLALALPSAAVITKKIIVPAGQQDNELELQVETEAAVLLLISRTPSCRKTWSAGST